MSVLLCELSGGYDSAAAALLCLRAGHTIHALWTDYGQKYAARELAAAQYVARHLARFSNFKGLSVASCQLQQALPDATVPAAYVPIRNLVLGALSANHAQALGAESVVVGSKTTTLRPDDPYCFFDCSTEFYDRLGALVTAASQPGTSTRFVQALVKSGVAYTKAEVVKLLLDDALDITQLWNCYADGETPCKGCFHCCEMRDVLLQLGRYDDFKHWW